MGEQGGEQIRDETVVRLGENKEGAIVAPADDVAVQFGVLECVGELRDKRFRFLSRRLLARRKSGRVVLILVSLRRSGSQLQRTESAREKSEREARYGD